MLFKRARKRCAARSAIGAKGHAVTSNYVGVDPARETPRASVLFPYAVARSKAFRFSLAERAAYQSARSKKSTGLCLAQWNRRSASPVPDNAECIGSTG